MLGNIVIFIRCNYNQYDFFLSLRKRFISVLFCVLYYKKIKGPFFLHLFIIEHLQRIQLLGDK